ncbi:MAG TPA: hypothetical protein VNA16_02935 [Abditibacteriaceae bacterium]|nr:hypothetical protein [Abditibacteriaceae bacterium]
MLLLTLAGVQAEAALYLDGGDGHILLGNLGGSTFYLQAQADLSDEELAPDARVLEESRRQKSRAREPLFDRPFLRDNLVRHSSVSLRRLVDATGRRLALAFYTVEGEDPQVIQSKLENLIEQALGANLSRYRVTLRQPWFELASTVALSIVSYALHHRYDENSEQLHYSFLNLSPRASIEPSHTQNIKL